MNSPLNPVQEVDFTFIYITAISFIILLGICATTIFFLHKYSREKNPNPADIRGNALLETLWIVIPTLLALSMFWYGWQSYLGLRNVPKDAYQIKAVAKKFAWEFHHPNGEMAEDELVVPLGTPVKVTLHSTDVLHSFSVPAFRIKIDAVPGMDTYAWFLPNKLGEYTIYCAEFCGTGHADMTANLRIVAKEEFQEYLTELEQEDEDEDEDEE